MRIGGDRHEVGERVFQTLFPAGAGTLLGLLPGQDLAAMVAKAGPPALGGATSTWRWELEDPHASGRRVEVAVHLINHRASAITGRFWSRDRMDIDAAWRPIRAHLEAVHGPPGREVGAMLKLVWRSATPAHVTRICRFKDEQGQDVLEIDTRAS
ncbi:MAG TPA: hypothetical protein PKA64_23220 [Myxococcota bacterium]|nr:hypothetical protein [Myxococcota bacterium]